MKIEINGKLLETHTKECDAFLEKLEKENRFEALEDYKENYTYYHFREYGYEPDEHAYAQIEKDCSRYGKFYMQELNRILKGGVENDKY